MVSKNKYWKVMESIKYLFFVDYSSANENTKALVYCSITHTIQLSGVIALDTLLSYLDEERYLKISPTLKKHVTI